MKHQSILLESQELSFHGSRIQMNSANKQGNNIERNGIDGPASSPTFAKVWCDKQEQTQNERQPHSMPSEPLPALDHIMSDHFMNASDSSSDLMCGSFCSVGLPSSYPLHPRTSSITTLEEELEEIYYIGEKGTMIKKALEESFSSIPEDCSKEARGLPQSPPATRGSVRSKGINLNIANSSQMKDSNMGGVDDLLVPVRPAKGHGHRRSRHQGLGPTDFHEGILANIFEDVLDLEKAR